MAPAETFVAPSAPQAIPSPAPVVAPLVALPTTGLAAWRTKRGRPSPPSKQAMLCVWII